MSPFLDSQYSSTDAERATRSQERSCGKSWPEPEYRRALLYSTSNAFYGSYVELLVTSRILMVDGSSYLTLWSAERILISSLVQFGFSIGNGLGFPTNLLSLRSTADRSMRQKLLLVRLLSSTESEVDLYKLEKNCFSSTAIATSKC